MAPSQFSIVVVGSLNLDLLLHVPHLPVAGETQSVTRFYRLPGGKGANQAVAAARLGASTAMLGAIGRDDAGRLLLDALHDGGVDTRHISRQADASTGTATILLTPAGENSIVIAPGANASLSAANVREHRALLAQAAMVLTQLETPVPVLEELAAMTQAEDIALMLDPAPACALDPGVLRRLAWFTPNETEAAFYLQARVPTTGALRELCGRLQAMGPRNILLKLGSRGACVLMEGGEFFHAAAPSVTVVDTTGAGDTLNAAFAVALLRGDEIAAALQFAVAAASLSVTRMGAMAAAPLERELAEFIAQAKASQSSH